MVTQDRRSAGRIRAYQPVRLSRPGQPQIIESLTKDLSGGGLKCLAPAAIPRGADVGVEVNLAPGQEPLIARGRVVWFSDLPDSEQFDIGIQFLSISAADKRRLSSYIERPTRQISAT